MSSIQETVDTSLSAAGYGQYGQYAAPVVTALVNREQQIVGRLIEVAQNTDLDTAAVRDVLQEIGMHMPPAPVENTQTPFDATPAPEGDLAGTLGRIEQALTGLTAFARQNGYNG